MPNETWKEQYDRMKRSFELLKEVGQPTALPQDVVPGRDVLYHFCCDVFHLRDWIAATVGTNKNDTDRIREQLNNDVIVPSPELSACSDIANGFKHLVLDRRSFVTGTNQGHAEVVSQGIHICPAPALIRITSTATFSLTHPDGSVDTDPEAPPPPPPAPAPATVGGRRDTFMIDIDGQQHDAQDVATKAVAAWDQWLAGPIAIAAQLRQT